MKIALLADLHFGNNVYLPDEGDAPFTLEEHQKFAAQVHAEKPDVVLIAGDVAETCIDMALFKECLDTYKNPHGASILVPGNHDMWIMQKRRIPELGGVYMVPAPGNPLTAEKKYEILSWQAKENGWVFLKDEPWEKDGYWIAGNMGWFDFSAIPSEVGLTGEFYEKNKRQNWSDYHYMDLAFSTDKTPMMDFCKRRMAEFKAALEKVPKDRKGLLVVTHIVGFPELMGPKRDEFSAFFGNFEVGRLAVQYEADVYCCGHTHSHADLVAGNMRRLNNGSGYGLGSKRYDVIEMS